MLSKVLSLAWDGQETGHVILQTRIPDHYVLKAILHNDPKAFYEQELALREVLRYPPATHLILLVVGGAQASRVQRVVDFLVPRLKKFEAGGAYREKGTGALETPMALGPIASRKPGRLKKNRMLFLIKTDNLPETQRCLREIQREYEAEFSKDPVVFEVNVDPIDIQ
jgi:primosomal protein N'